MKLFSNLKIFLKTKTVETLNDKKKLTILVIAFLLLIIFLFNNKGFVKRYGLEGERREIILKIENAKKEKTDLKNKINDLKNNPDTIEKVAREKWGMIKEGEKVFRVKPEKKD